MNEIIPMFGVYDYPQAASVREWLYDLWSPVCQRAVVYIRVHGTAKTASQRAEYVEAVIHSFEATKLDGMSIIYGFEVCAGSLACEPIDYFRQPRWEALKRLSVVVQRASRRREVVWVHESGTARIVAENPTLTNSAEAHAAYEAVRGMEIWHDYPVARFADWFRNVRQWRPPRIPGVTHAIGWPRRWKNIGPVPGFYDPDVQDIGSAQWKELQAHKMLGKDWIPRVFVSSTGKYGGDGDLCFDARENEGLPSRNLKAYLSKPRDTPVIVYPGHAEAANVARAMKGWYP